MQFSEKTIVLKDGRTGILRAPREADAAEMALMIRRIVGETEFILRTPEESTETPETEAAFIARFLESPDQLMLVCEVDGKIAGDCDIFFLNRIKVRHRARLGIGVLKEYWNLGIGTALMAEMIRAAQARAGVTQLELEFVEGNTRGQALYEKMGFHITGVLPGGVRLRSGEMRSLISMVRPIP